MRRNFLLSSGLLLAIILVVILQLVSPLNTVPKNISTIENVTRPDEVKAWEKLEKIENVSMAPSITIGGLNTLYGRGETLTVFASLLLHGIPVNASYSNLTIVHHNGSHLIYDLNSTPMIKISRGWYYLNWAIPGDADHGTYSVLVKADPNGRETQATGGFKVGFKLNVTITVDVAEIREMLDCDNVNDSAICDYTDGLQSSVDKIQDMLNCSNLGNNSDLCGYAERIERNLTQLSGMLTDHNQTIFEKLLTIETTADAIHSNATAIWESLDCDNFSVSTYDVCKVVEDIKILSQMINLTTQEINETTAQILNTVNYINEVRWGNFSYTLPVPTVLILQGKIKSKSTDDYLSIGSLQVNISDPYIPNVVWSHEYNDVITDGMFNLLLGGTYDLSLIPKRKYKRDLTICNGPTFNVTLYICETFTTYFIA